MRKTELYYAINGLIVEGWKLAGILAETPPFQSMVCDNRSCDRCKLVDFIEHWTAIRDSNLAQEVEP